MQARVNDKGVLNFQFPVGMSNRSYRLVEIDENLYINFFQFPVGMSNRSYRFEQKVAEAKQIIFQFPVGMSNRSYLLKRCEHGQGKSKTFNSPWEYRIGPTKRQGVLICHRRDLFQFPVGMSNRSYCV